MSADTLEMMFREFCLPTMATRWAELLQSAEAQNWGYRKLLLQLFALCRRFRSPAYLRQRSHRP